MNLGPIQVSGELFLADPPEDSFIDVRMAVMGIFQVQILSHVGGTSTVAVTLPDGPGTFTISYSVPTGSFLCQVQPKDTREEAKWHVLATVSGPAPIQD